MTTKPKSLIEAARYVLEWDGDPTVDVGFDRLRDAMRALPPDAVVVSAGLLREAADMMDGIYPNHTDWNQMVARLSKAAAEGGGE